MYLVGIIPGPTKPSLHEINHFLKLIVDDLALFWTPGVFFSRTAKYSDGRLVQAALVPLVCDLLAACQVAGYAGHQSTFFCHYCLLPREDIENFNRATWKPRHYHTHLDLAKAWRDAETQEEQADIYEKHGIRWTELLRLPYWNPIHFTVVDSMHNLYLGLLKTHVRDIWGMDIDLLDGDSTVSPVAKVIPRPAEALMIEATNALETGSAEALAKIRRAALWHLCKDRNCRRASTTKGLIKQLMKWVSFRDVSVRGLSSEPEEKDRRDIEDAELHLTSRSEVKKAKKQLLLYKKKILEKLCDSRHLSRKGNKTQLVDRLLGWVRRRTSRNNAAENVAPPEDGHSHGAEDPEALFLPPFFVGGGDTVEKVVLGISTLHEVKKDMAKTELPSWISPAPKNLGSTSQGKLSADQMLTTCTIHLPITLIRLWGNLEGRPHEMLANYLDLIVAVEIGSMLTTSPAHIKIYDERMVRYLETMIDLYKEAKVQPNHHLSLHLGDFLYAFGPVHAWRAFAFERYNYIFQQEKTNQKFGELELTFMNHTCRSANLRPLMRDPVINEKMSELLEAYRKLEEEDRRGTRLTEINILNPEHREPVTFGQAKRDLIELDRSIYRSLLSLFNMECPNQFAPYYGLPATPGLLVLSRSAKRHEKMQISGVSYQSHDRSPKDSNIIYKASDGSENAGRIVSIFTHTRSGAGEDVISEVFLAVQKLEELSDIHSVFDKFRTFALVGGTLYYDKYQDKIQVIRPRQVLCHFARTSMRIDHIEEPCVHVLRLDRVSLQCIAARSLLTSQYAL
ncbi:hypothetical protein BV25DRAFT_1816687 [Artomyces pyxidatus]|uniref:Uncharacterized protein n=1 Tax=Artomyces pyxidatus TaxID=48021 RepID=A0ACB8SFM0_9AGAM|nr:hypothetical protein BV25DRAFT_1816687 [Artomyces pyxidatus]